MNHNVPMPRLFFHGLRISLGLIYFHFGFLKFLPGVSPAESLAGDTISKLLAGMVDSESAVFVLAILECGLGLLFLANQRPKLAYFLFVGHMIGTFSPMFLLPHLTFNQHLLIPTLEGQYILKNIVFLAGVSAIYLPHLYPSVNWDEATQIPAWQAKEIELPQPENQHG